MMACFLKDLRKHKERGSESSESGSGRLILKKLTKDNNNNNDNYNNNKRFSPLLWNRHRLVTVGTVRNVQIILSCAMMVYWIT